MSRCLDAPRILFVVFAASCGADGRLDEPPDPLGGCALDADCPTGLLCRDAACVSSEDQRPPELETEARLLQPIATDRYLFAPSIDTNSVLLVDPASLDITAVPVPAEPVAVALVPNRDAVAVLSREGRSLGLLGVEPTISLRSAPLPRRFGAQEISPDGRYALVYTPDGTTPDDGAEGLIAIVDLEALASGEAVAPIELAAGYRHTDVFFLLERGAATLAVVLGKEEVTLIELARAGTPGYLPQRIVLPSTLAEVIGREAVAAEASRHVLLRALGHPGIAVLDVDAGTLETIPLPSNPTDLELAADGTFAIAALRAAGLVAVLPLPEVLTTTTAVRLIAIDGVVPGQIELAPIDGTVIVFSATDTDERFALLDTVTATVTVFDRLKKKLRQVALSDDGRSAIVLHEPEPDSMAADLYERQVDRDEGYSIVDLATGATQLERTGTIRAQAVVFSGRRAAVTLLDAEGAQHRVDAIDLDTLITRGFPLTSRPEFVGAFEGADPRVWITQEHVAGRISILDLAEAALRTLTGFRVDVEIEGGDR